MAGDDCHWLLELSGVSPTGKILGQGAYARVIELTYRNLRCAGKKILPELTGYSKKEQVGVLRRAREECVTLSQMKHPNIVQFLGVHFEDENPLPILVMEFMPFTLTRHIEKNGVSTPYPVLNYSILADVAKALCYLHGGDPIVIHRDLTSNNVLLTYDMTAKVSDLGTAKMLNMSAKTFSKLSRCPGTPAYMPPEAQYDDTDYDETLDCFSYGILMLHMFCGEWPLPKNDDTRMLSEIERRQKYIKNVKDCHLMGLIEKCLKSKDQRPSAKEILEEVQRVQQSFGPQPTKAMLLDQVKLDADTKDDMTKEISKLEDKQSRLKTEVKRLENLLFIERQEVTAAKESFERRIHDLKSEMATRDSDKKHSERCLQSEIDGMQGEIKLLKESKEREINNYKESLLEKESIINDIKTRNEDQARKAHNDLHTYESQKGRIIEHLRSGTQVRGIIDEGWIMYHGTNCLCRNLS
jgi:serine/threonine protein kinase